MIRDNGSCVMCDSLFAIETLEGCKRLDIFLVSLYCVFIAKEAK